MNIFYINLSIHLFTLDYDTTNKVGTKRAACQAAIDVGYSLLHLLGKEMITEEMVCNAQRFYVHYIAKKRGVSTFDDLR